jgi:hypothetical protein
MQLSASRPSIFIVGVALRQAVRRSFSNGALLAVAMTLISSGARGAAAQDQDIQLTGTFGVGYSNGGYGTNRNTDVLLNMTTFSLETDDLKFAVSMPYMRISGRGLLVFDAAGNPEVINRRTSIVPDVRTGFGDLNFSGTYSIPPSILDDFQVKLTARIKAPTASERRRLSTGKADFGMSVDISREFGIWGPFITVGYLVPGKPAAYSLNNTVSISAGTSIELSDNLVSILSYDYDSESSPLVGSSKEMFGSLSWIVSKSITLTGYGSAGLSSGSPDVGGGMLVSYGFN